MLDEIIDALFRSPRPYASADVPAAPGLYAFFLAASMSLPPFADGGDLIYVGKSESSLKTRDLDQHFQAGATGHSTVRRSLGAILRPNLSFRALPRSPRCTDQDLRCYRFRQEDEQVLSAWMRQNVKIGYVALQKPKADIADLEKHVLDVLIPPLNIDRRSAKRNRFAQILRKLRAECRDEAASEGRK